MTTETYSPREIIQQLDLDEIDQSIEDLKEELSALQQLRKVAAAKSGKGGSSKGGRGNGRSSSSEKANLAVQVLQEFGSLHFKKLAERVGYPANSAFWILRIAEKDSRFSVNDETISLA